MGSVTEGGGPGGLLLAARQLGALGWPGGPPRGEGGWREAVAWLEDTKVRGLPEGERGPLRAGGEPGWPAAFAAYLERLECPLERGSSNSGAQLGWLVSHAVMLEFQDRAPEFNAALGARQRRAGHGGEVGEPRRQGETAGDAGGRPGGLAAQLAQSAGSPEAVSLGAEVCEALGVEGSVGNAVGAGGLAERLEACRRAVRRRQAAAALLDGAATDLGSLPLGFNMGTGEGAPALENAAKVLRALYIQDLRDLQTQVDRLVVQAQEYTANPKTDSSLGRTGR